MEEMLRVQQDSLAKYKNELDELKHAYRKENEEYPDQGSENDLFGGASAQVL
jgi:MoxR-like ATPase